MNHVQRMTFAQRHRLTLVLTMMLQGHTHEYRVAKFERLRKARQARKNRAHHRQAWWEAKKASDANKVAAQVHGVDPETLELMKRYELL